MSRRGQQSLEPGQDSFLDVVANLVGILIILITVIGVQTKQAMIVADKSEVPPEISAAELKERTSAAKNLLAESQFEEQRMERDIVANLNELQQHELEVDYRQRERDRLQFLLNAVTRQMEEQKKDLDDNRRRHIDVQRDLELARQDAARVELAVRAAKQDEDKTVVLKHLPTPMAKTVFGKEIHFRLQNGRIAHVPFDAMIELLHQDAQRQAWKLKDAPAIEEQLGPINGFRMNYRLVRKTFSTTTRVGTVTRSGVELDWFHLHPVSEDLGENVESALHNGSQFHDILELNPPRNTTITIWVYPDSFGLYRELKHALYDRGYLTAARPMPAGQSIGGSPRGSRSAAQ